MPRSEPRAAIYMQSSPKSPISEAYRNLKINLEYSAAAGGEIKTIAVTSAYPAEGKTTTAINLAVALTRAGKKVLLIDANLRKPELHLIFGVADGIGFTNGLVKQTDPKALVRETEIEQLTVMTAGTLLSNPS